MTFNLIILIPMNMFVLLVMIVHICYLSGDVDHSVCLAITIVRTRGGGEDYALRVHVDPDLHVSILAPAFDSKWFFCFCPCACVFYFSD